MLLKIDQYDPLFEQDGDRQRLQLFLLLISISIPRFSTVGNSVLILGFIFKKIEFLT